MGAPESISERTRVEVHDNVILDAGVLATEADIANPNIHSLIHFSGASLLVNNSSAIVAALFSISDSPDGTTWTPILFSADSQSLLTTFSICPLGQQSFLFESIRRYVRFTVTPYNPEGVQIVLSQFIPRAAVAAEIY